MACNPADFSLASQTPTHLHGSQKARYGEQAKS